MKKPGPDAGKGAPATGYVFAIAAALLWGVAGTVAKYLFNNNVTALTLTQVRMTGSFILMMAYFLIARRELARIQRKDIGYLAVLGVGGLALVQISYYSAIANIQVAAAILLQYMAPIFIFLYAVTFMRERATPAKLSALVLAVSGCALVAGVYNIDFLKLNLTGVAWGLMSALCFTFYTLYGQAALRKYSAMTLFCYASGFGSLLWWIVNPPQVFFAVRYSPLVWLTFLYVTVFGTIVPFVFYFVALSRLEASRVSITSTLEPVVAGVVAFLFIGEKMGFLQVLGGILVIAAIVVLQRSHAPELPHHPVPNDHPH
jgi:drug/metabolite transporter (DMT)-like permease